MKSDLAILHGHSCNYQLIFQNIIDLFNVAKSQQSIDEWFEAVALSADINMNNLHGFI